MTKPGSTKNLCPTPGRHGIPPFRGLLAHRALPPGAPEGATSRGAGSSAHRTLAIRSGYSATVPVRRESVVPVVDDRSEVSDGDLRDLDPLQGLLQGGKYGSPGL
jgi:hypothetical protein